MTFEFWKYFGKEIGRLNEETFFGGKITWFDLEFFDFWSYKRFLRKRSDFEAIFPIEKCKIPSFPRLKIPPPQ